MFHGKELPAPHHIVTETDSVHKAGEYSWLSGKVDKSKIKKISYQDDAPLQEITLNIESRSEESVDIRNQVDRLLTKTAAMVEDLQDKKQIRFGVEQEAAKKEAEVGSVSKGMRLEHRTNPKPCERFLSVDVFATSFVKEIIEDSLAKERFIQKETTSRIIEGIECHVKDHDSISSETSIGTYVCVLEWPTIDEFNVDLGAAKIQEYFSYWKFVEDWKYCVNYLKSESDETCDFYRYEVIFSIPCKQYPIPQATASIYFTYEVSRVRPKNCLVDIYYCFEGKRLMHTPGQFKLQEDWLFQIVDAKIKFYQTIKF